MYQGINDSIKENDGEDTVNTPDERIGENAAKNRADNKHLFTPAAILIAGIMISTTLVYTNGIPQGGLASSKNLAAQAGAGELAAPSDPTQPAGQPGGNQPVVELNITEEDHIRGNIDAPITIVEYSDFQCPFCQRFHPTVSQALDEYGDDIRWVYRHFPLSQIHPEAIASAEASECVAEQAGNDGFWKFADIVFEDQVRMGPALYREIASSIGVDIAQYDLCVSERRFKEKVEQHQSLGIQVGITGTPGGFVNNQPVRGAIPYAQLKAIIDAELQ